MVGLSTTVGVGVGKEGRMVGLGCVFDGDGRMDCVFDGDGRMDCVFDGDGVVLVLTGPADPGEPKGTRA